MSKNSTLKKQNQLLQRESNLLRIISPSNPSTVLTDNLEVKFEVSQSHSFDNILFTFKNLNTGHAVNKKPKNIKVIAEAKGEFTCKASVFIGDLLPSSNQINYDLFLTSEYFKREEESLPIRLSLTPKDNFNKTFLGYYSPPYAFHSGAYLPVLFWGVRKNSKLIKASIFSGTKQLREIENFAELPHVNAALPGLSASSDRCGVSTIFKREEFKNPSTIYLNAKLLFETAKGNEEFEISIPKLSWTKQTKEKPYSKIESVKLSEKGELILTGFYFSKYARRPEFVLRTLNSGVILKEFLQSQHSNIISIDFKKRNDIFVKNLAQASKLEFGFEIKLQPEIFGSKPGLIAAFFKFEDEEIPLGRLLDFIKAGNLYSSQANEGSVKDYLLQKARIASQVPSLFFNPSSLDSKTKEEAILLCSPNLSPYQGAPKVLLEIARQIKADSSKKLLISSEEGELRADFEKLGFEVLVINELALKPLGFNEYLTGLEKAENFLKNFKLKQVLANTIDCFWAIRISKNIKEKSDNFKANWFFHESTPPEFSHLQLDFRQRAHFFEAFNLVDKFIFVSKSSKNIYSKLTGSKQVQLIPNGIEIDEQKVSSVLAQRNEYRTLFDFDDKFVFLTLGSICKRKGQDLLINSLKHIDRNKLSKMRFVLVGAKPSEFLNELNQQIASLNLNEYVQIFEETREVAKFLSAADSVIIPSREESAPLVSLEASLYRLPIISSNVNGLKEQLAHGKNALLFNSEDEVALSKHINQIFESKSIRDSLASSSMLNLSKNYNLSEIRKSYQKLF